MKDTELGLIPVPCHFMVLDCELLQGIVPDAVCPALPLDEVVMILGNKLAGTAVWANMQQSLMIISKLLVSVEPDKSGQSDPWVFPGD